MDASYSATQKIQLSRLVKHFNPESITIGQAKLLVERELPTTVDVISYLERCFAYRADYRKLVAVLESSNDATI